MIEAVTNNQSISVIEWWEIENTGWSGGSSWFQCGGTEHNPYRAKSETEAVRYIQKSRWGDPDVKWRYIHVTLERTHNKSVEIREWTIVD